MKIKIGKIEGGGFTGRVGKVCLKIDREIIFLLLL